MTWQDVGKKILELAPTAAGIAAPLLGPAGPLLPLAVKAICTYFGVDASKNPTPEEVAAAIQGDPEFLQKLTLAQMDFQKEEMRLEFADIQSARIRQTEHEKATGKSDFNLYALAWLFVGGFFLTYIVMLVLIMIGRFPQNMSPAATYLIGTLNGTLTAGVGAVVQYFFGKTKDSEAHVNALSNSIPLDQIKPLLKGLFPTVEVTPKS